MDVRLLWLALGAFAGSVESSVIVTFLPMIGAETGVGVAEAGLMVFCYSLAYGLGTPILSTIFGGRDRRFVVVLAELVFGCGALLIGLLPGFVAILLARTFLAFGAGLFTSTAQSTAVALAVPGKRGKAISTVVLGGSLAVAFGAPLGAWAGQTFGWRPTYIVLGAIALIAATTMALRLPGTIAGDRRGLAERLSLVRVPGVPAVLLASLLGLVAMFVVLIYLAPVTTQMMHMDGKLMPYVLLAFGIGAIGGNQLGGLLTDRIGARQTTLVISAALIVVLLALPVVAALPAGWVAPAYFALMLVFGAVQWSFFPPQLIRLAALSPESVTLGASLNLTAMNIGGALAALLGGQVIERLGISAICWVGAAIAVATILVIYLAPDRRPLAVGAR